MKIKIDEIPESGLVLDLTEKGEELEALAPGSDFSIVSPVTARLSVRRSDGTVEVRGEVKARLSLACSRCLDDFMFDVSKPFTGRFAPPKAGDGGGEEGAQEKELSGKDMGVDLLAGPDVDTHRILAEQIVLDIPIKPLCSQRCKGLCYTCGANLNEGPCSCRREAKTDSRFAKLKDFKVK